MLEGFIAKRFTGGFEMNELDESKEKELENKTLSELMAAIKDDMIAKPYSSLPIDDDRLVPYISILIICQHLWIRRTRIFNFNGTYTFVYEVEVYYKED